MKSVLDFALAYLDRKISVIPTKRADKRPCLMSWAPYQQALPTEENVKKWWSDFPEANVSVITGPLSGVMIIDVDQAEIPEEVGSLLPENLVTPTARTPRGGWHFYFKYREGLRTCSKIMGPVDIRTAGGYAQAPPSLGPEASGYRWLEGLSFFDIPLAPIPDALFKALYKALHGVPRKEKQEDSEPKMISVDFSEGSRDNTMYHVALCLLRGRMHPDNAEETLLHLAQTCSPPYPESDIKDKIRSALKKAQIDKRDFEPEVRDWLSQTWGNIAVMDFLKDRDVKNQDEKARVRQVFEDFAKKGVIEKLPEKNGCYRRVDANAVVMNFAAAKAETVPMMLPFNMGHLVEIMPGNIILVAGEPNSGKTSFLLNIVRDNMGIFETHYFNSEMGQGELRKRLEKFDGIRVDDWRFKAYERSDRFEDILKPGKGKLNVIDYLEIHDNFYEIGGRIAAIHKKLNGAIAVIAIQKNKGTDFGRGGMATLDKPRLAVALSPGKIKIVKAKNWRTDQNPNGLELEFKLIQGSKFWETTPWRRPKKEA